MIVICCAMYCEAVMLINYYNLKKIEYNAFQIYEDAEKSMLVVISGVGKNAASTAIGTIAGKYSIDKSHYIINFGSAAGNKARIGKLFIGDKLGIIALTCRITDALKKKGKNVTCYDVLLKVGKNFGEVEKNTFLKSLACICEDIMYGVTDYPDFGVKLSDAPKQLSKLLDNYIPF